MSFRFILPILFCSLLCLGCGRKELPYVDNSQDAELYAKSLRAMIESGCSAAKKGDPLLFLGPVMQELERTDRPIGNRQEIINELRTYCREAMELIQKSEGKTPNIKANMDQMIEIAGKLPANDKATAKLPKDAVP